MTWYAVHVIMYVKYKKKKQLNYPVWENIYLFESSSPEDALKKAQIRGKNEEGDSGGTFEWDGNPATMVFAGIRKIIECQNSPEQMIHNPTEDKPGDGAEVSYSQFEIKKEENLKKLIAGQPVEIIYLE